MDKNYFHIKELARYLDGELRGAVIEEAFTQEKDKFVTGLSIGSDELFLEFSASKKNEYLLFRRGFSKAKKNVAGLFGELVGDKVKGIGLYNDDRVIKLELESRKQVLFSFIRGLYNCFVTDNGVIVNSFKDRNELLQKRLEEVFPERNAGKGIEVKTVKDYLKGNYTHYGNLYGREVLFRAGLENEDKIKENEDVLDEGFNGLRSELDNPGYFFYEKDGDIKTSLVELQHLKGYRRKDFGSINELIEYQNKYSYKEEKVKDVLESKKDKLKKEIKNVDGNISNLNKTVEEFKQADKLRVYGDLILANLANIKEGDKKLTVTDPVTYKEIEIKLNSDLKPAENANRYYEKFKKQKNAIDDIEKRVKKFEKEKEKLEKELEELEKIEDFQEVKKLEKEIKKEGKPDETSRFRKFVLSDKYEVWVGKDSKSNDLLTTKHSAPNDLWFHVRGASGSHTVLKVSSKKDEVPKEIIKKAASISAYYSKARGASMVPVAYCEKKFVKKPKGAKSGSVIMTREKVVNVKPELPED